MVQRISVNLAVLFVSLVMIASCAQRQSIESYTYDPPRSAMLDQGGLPVDQAQQSQTQIPEPIGYNPSNLNIPQTIPEPVAQKPIEQPAQKVDGLSAAVLSDDDPEAKAPSVKLGGSISNDFVASAEPVQEKRVELPADFGQESKVQVAADSSQEKKIQDVKPIKKKKHAKHPKRKIAKSEKKVQPLAAEKIQRQPIQNMVADKQPEPALPSPVQDPALVPPIQSEAAITNAISPLVVNQMKADAKKQNSRSIMIIGIVGLAALALIGMIIFIRRKHRYSYTAMHDNEPTDHI